ncbi:MAG TPA: hypothetical protein VMF89_10225, partial [Polyangiales bacterium]|nr:hypothetical protein [Polyangiales bacterium]
LFAFQEEVAPDELRDRLLALVDREGLQAQLRAIAGIAAYTTIHVPDRSTRYRPYTDKWAPGFLIELKSNAPALYSALRDQRSRATPPARGVPEIVLDHYLKGPSLPGEPELENTDALLAALNGVKGELDQSALITAATYFRYSSEAPAPTVEARTPWAKLASSYADMFRLGLHNDYEKVLPVLRSMRDQTSALPPAARSAG